MFDKRRILKNGVLAKAEVLSVAERSKYTSNELRDYDHVVRVRATEHEPFEAKIRDKFWIVGLRPKLGDILDVRYDPKSLETVFVLDGDPRYDVKALEAKNDAQRSALPESMRDGSARPTAAFTPDIAQALAQAQAVTQAQAASAGAAMDPLERLERLARLRDAGVLTEGEFAAQKAKILSDG